MSGPRNVSRGRVATRVALIVVALSAACALLLSRGMGFSARMRPFGAEETLMRLARNWATPASARDARNPVVAGADAVSAGMDHWADHCAVCHANDGSGQTSVGRNLYPPAPDMRAARTQALV